jgi:hypothetical protein
LAIRGRLMHSLRLAVFSILLVVLGCELKAQQTTAPSLADYVGTYADTTGHPVEILSADEFFAVQDCIFDDVRT